MPRLQQSNIVLSLCAACFLLLRCGPNALDGGTHTGNARITGTLYQPDGKTPAAGVAVAIRPRKTLADTNGLVRETTADTATVKTNGAGRFAFDSTLDTGTYVIEAASGNNAVLIDSVQVTKPSGTDTLPPDTLKPAGAIQGVVKLSEGGDPRKVFILAFGIDRFAKVNADGSFSFTRLAEAAYDIRLISSLDHYGVLDTAGIRVTSGDTTNLDTLYLPYSGIPTPKNVRIEYDTMKQFVTLKWDKADTTLVKGYNVYRRNVDSNTIPVRINTSPIADFLYRDSSGLEEVTYEYRVAAVSPGEMEGAKSAGVSVKMVEGFIITDTILTAGGYINALDIDKNGNYAVVRYIEPFRPAAKVERYDSKGILLASWDIPAGIEYSYVYNNIAFYDPNRIFVINLFNTLFEFDSVGTVKSSIQLPGPIRGFSIFRDTFYFGNTAKHKIYAYSTKGDSLHSWGSKGFSDGQFENIVSILCDPTGNVYVEDAYNYGRIQIFGSDGSFLRSFDLQSFSIVNGCTDIVAARLDVRDSILLLTGSNVYGYTTHGIMQFRVRGIPLPQQAYFDSDGDINVALWTGSIVKIGKK